MSETLSIFELEKNFGNTKILKKISFEVRQGDFISLLGPSGSGKTTLLRCIAGLERPDSGQISLGSIHLSKKNLFILPEKRNFGMVFQNYAVWPHLNVFENIAFPLRVRAKMTLDEVNSKVYRALSQVKLSGLENRFAHELSGGQQQRVALARALVMSPKVLLLDEPLSNLDALLREELGTEIRKLQQELNLTTLLVTHDQREALSFSDRIFVLNEGQIVASGKPEDLYFKPSSTFVAEFISGGQTVTLHGGNKKIFLPRRWTPYKNDSEKLKYPLYSLEIASRTFQGKEYEYWAKTEEILEPVRFYSTEKLDIGKKFPFYYT